MQSGLVTSFAVAVAFFCSCIFSPYVLLSFHLAKGKHHIWSSPTIFCKMSCFVAILTRIINIFACNFTAFSSF
uniref:Uncharacterized protein n=1 Tax=Rhizophora mucronata TaxID=61149 RepID=A0A2P2QT63_RHIMU